MASRIVRGNNDTPIPVDPTRLSLRSKSFFLKAIPGPNSSAQKVMRRISSNVSKRVKHPPRAERHSSGFYCGDGNLTSSVMSCSDCQDVPAVSIASRRISFHADNNTPSLLTLDSPYTIGSQGTLILCPKIDVTPELSIVDTSACSLWIAIEVTGLLRRADGQEEYGNGADRYPSRSSTQLAGNSNLRDICFMTWLMSIRPQMLRTPACYANRSLARSRLYDIGNLWRSPRPQNSPC